jgi:hypothetical protein
MAEERQTAAVSRSEFYGVLNITWWYICLLVADQLRQKQGLWLSWLFVGALGMSLFMLLRVCQSKFGNKGGT